MTNTEIILTEKNAQLEKELAEKNRELEIEAALERVRAAAMAMHSSEGIMDVTQILREQIALLGEKELESILVHIYNEKADEFEAWYSYRHPDDPDGKIATGRCVLNWSKTARARLDKEKYQTNETDYTIVADYTILKEWYEYLFGIIPEVVEVNSEEKILVPDVLFYNYSKILGGALLLITNSEASQQSKDLLRRASKVFNLAYARFLDLQKAEAQARDAQIELALERVRARTMAMQKSDELKDAAALLFHQVELLGAKSFACGFNIWGEERKTVIIWMAQESMIQPPYITNTSEDVFYDIHQAAQRGETLYVKVQEGKDLQVHYHYMSTIPDFKRIMEKMAQEGLSVPIFQILHSAFFSHGYLLFITYEKVHEMWDIFKRFAKVFEQTYIRFLDLQKAEAQAREAQIELALERVRARTMAMQKSDELQELSKILIQQIILLNFPLFGFGIHICRENEPVSKAWIGDPTKGQLPTVLYEHTHDSVSKLMYEGWKQGESLLVKKIEGKELKEHFEYLISITPIRSIFETVTPPKFIIYHFAYFSHGFFVIAMLSPYEEAHTIFKRFAKVFEQTYTRFLDLQKAETQVREAEIELALERVRARTMAMQKSEELHETSQILFQQMKELGEPVEQLTIGIIKETENVVEIFATIQGIQLQQSVRHSIDEMVMNKIYTGWKTQQKSLLIEMNSKEIQAYNRYRNELVKAEMFSTTLLKDDRRIIYAAYFSKGMLALGSNTPLSEESHRLLERFAGVFDGIYTRFLDLQKAEAQARESQIEAALERVRSRTMAMQKSDELNDVASSLFAQVNALGIKTWTSGFNLWSEDNNSYVDYITSPNGGFIEPYTVHTEKAEALRDISDARKSGVEFEVLYVEGDKIKKLYQALTGLGEKQFEKMLEDGVQFPSQQYEHFVFGSKISLMFITYEPVPEAHDIFKRLGKVFEQTYTRFLDLQKAEAQARESQIETGLERVRSRTLAMQKSDELAATSLVVFKELINLGIEPNRLFIGIFNEKISGINAWVTNEDGTKIDNHFTIRADKNKSVKKMYDGWKEKQISIVIDMQGEELQHYFEYLVHEMQLPFKNGLSHKRRVQTIAYFGQGLIGMASPNEQPAETIFLLERFAAVFNLTYTRFNDLKIAEKNAAQAEKDLFAIKEAKQKAEKSLIELQATQTQLIQSEKMASLGELTAGIAHEIQNPLNFVNNFSEVSTELLAEMKMELDAGKFDDAKNIANDVIQNLEKINHHGKRADAIVKGMLQHSRSSSNQKEPTDINALCDEYLRLSYHGLRAKDKSFNASMNTNFEASLEKVNIIPQDIGRVILNLLTNAFYAVDEKKKTMVEDYEPTVTVKTFRNPPSEGRGAQVLISVTDNGNGIPQKVIDKIFQPFFTTKPTGQGTGLGLSMSYDIVTKAHGGELRVETKDREGSVFTILLPIA